MKCSIRSLLAKVVDNRGKTPPISEYGHNLLEVNAVSASQKYPLYSEVRKKVSDNVYKTWFRSGHPQKGDILVPTVGTLGAVAFVNRNDCCIAQNIIALRVNTSICNSEFLYYLLSYDKIRKQLLNLNIGGVQPSIKVPHLLELKAEIPGLEQQIKIAQLLSSLDDKIELNAQINQNLEAQAQAIFKSWFVDFEPFGGVVPKNTKKVELQNICELITKGTTPTTLGFSFTNDGINFIKAESITDFHEFDLDKFAHIDIQTNDALKRSVIHPGDILFSIAGTLGRFAVANESILPANTNQAVAIIRPNPALASSNYIYSFFLGGWHKEHCRQRTQQAVQANLSLTTLRNIPVLLLPSYLMKKYENIIEPILAKILHNISENHVLSKMRDTLLPRLMSGEIDVSKVEI